LTPGAEILAAGRFAFTAFAARIYANPVRRPVISLLREDFGPESDVDVLVSFADDAPWSLWDLTAMGDELAAILGRPVDFVEKEGLRNPFRRRTILATRKVLYLEPEQ